MPQKSHVSDWDRLLNKDAPRRRGPIALFVTLTLMLAFVAVLMLGGGFGVRKYEESRAALALTSTPLWAQYYAQQTATAVAQHTVATPLPSERTAPIAVVGNFRSEPRVAPDTVIGKVQPGDVVALLESRTVDGQVWYRARVTTSKGGLAVGAEGWINGSLIASQ